MRNCTSTIAITPSEFLAPFYARCRYGAGHVGMHLWAEPDFDLTLHRLAGAPLRIQGQAQIGWDDFDYYGEQSKAYIFEFPSECKLKIEPVELDRQVLGWCQ